MITEELLGYIRTELVSGRSEDSIKKDLRDNGWPEEGIAQAFAILRPHAPAMPVPPVAAMGIERAAVAMPEQLQQMFPLSPKKFWKKYIDANISIGILFVVISVPVAMLGLALSKQDDFHASYAWWGILIVAVSMGIVSLLRAWYIRSYIRQYFYEGEEHYLTIRKGVFTSAEIHVPYHKIQDVYVDQDFLDRLMGLYDVHIASATAGSAIEAHIDGVEKLAADGLKNLLLAKVQGGATGAFGGDMSGASSQPAKSGITLAAGQRISNVEYPIISAWWIGDMLSTVAGSALTCIAIAFKLSEKNTVPIDTSMPILLGLFVVGFFWSIIRLSLFVKNYAFEFTPEYLYARYGAFSLTETHMPYSTIQDVRIEQSFFGKLFGVYTVAIENAVGGGKALSLVGLSKHSAESISAILKSQVLGVHDASRV